MRCWLNQYLLLRFFIILKIERIEDMKDMLTRRKKELRVELARMNKLLEKAPREKAPRNGGRAG